MDDLSINDAPAPAIPAVAPAGMALPSGPGSAAAGLVAGGLGDLFSQPAQPQPSPVTKQVPLLCSTIIQNFFVSYFDIIFQF